VGLSPSEVTVSGIRQIERAAAGTITGMSDLDNAFLGALEAGGAAPDRGGKMDLYGWLVGSWDLDVRELVPDGSTRRRPGEWHFGWVLEGRAVQDVWIVPPRPDTPEYYGTTLRVYDPRIDAWRIQWTEPVSQSYLSMVGRRQGDDIVQDGEAPDGTRIRWSFTDIMPDSFTWRFEASPAGGATWHERMEFSAVRRPPTGPAGR
jgi:hypothetical protein